MSRAANVVELYAHSPSFEKEKTGATRPTLVQNLPHLPPLPGENKNLSAVHRGEDRLPRDWSVMPKPEKRPEGNLIPKERGTYKLEPIIKPLPSHKTLTYIPDKPPIDYYALYDIERPTPSGDNPAIYRPKGKTVALDDLDPRSDLYQMWKLDFDIGEAWVRGQDRFLLDKEQEYVPELPKSTREQREALDLAQRENFFGMCESSLWGREVTECRQAFAEMLRGLVESFLPRTRWDLELLSTIADLQWKIRRTKELQRNLFQNGPVGHNAMGVPTKTVNAAKIDEQLKMLHSQLEQAIKTYRASQG